MFEQRAENVDYLGIVFQHVIAETQNLARENGVGVVGLVGLRLELAFEGWNSFGVEFGAEARQSPVAVQAGEIGLPCEGLLEELSGFREFRRFGPHHAQVVVGTAEDFSDKGTVLPGCLRFFCPGQRFGGWARRQALLDHALCALLLLR